MDRDKFKEVYLNEYGYYEIKNKPTSNELKEYYAQKYFQQQKGNYQKEYTEDEKQMTFNKLERKRHIAEVQTNYFQELNDFKFLDVGCGEGWALNFFSNYDWTVKGIDHSEHGCNTHNPQHTENILIGEIVEKLELLIKKNEKFNLIQLDNVLEHLISPSEMLDTLNPLMDENSLLIIEVPNDFSILQNFLLENDKIDEAFWLAHPDHLSYFNNEGLINLLNSSGYNNIDLISDYPIDLNLLNPDTNYVAVRSKGKNVHFARVNVENLLTEISIEKSIDLYRTFASMGIGRNIVGFFTK